MFSSTLMIWLWLYVCQYRYFMYECADRLCCFPVTWVHFSFTFPTWILFLSVCDCVLCYVCYRTCFFFLCLWVYDSLAFPLSVEFSPWLPFSRARFLFYVLSGCEMIVLFCFSAPILTISPRICAFIPCPHCLRIVCVRELEHFVTIALFSLFFSFELQL